MSFAYMPIYTGDYIRDTKHLTPEEHGIYILMLIHCWDQKGPVPLDERRQCGIVNARSGGEVESMRRVLSEFFVKMDDGYYNNRIMKEVAKFEGISQVRRKGGLEKARKMRDMVNDAVRGAQAEHKHSTSTTQAMDEQVSLSLSPSLSLSSGKAKKPRAQSRTISLEKTGSWSGISEEQVVIWTTAFPGIALQAELARAASWIDANPTRRPVNFARFLNTWFSKAQDRTAQIPKYLNDSPRERQNAESRRKLQALGLLKPNPTTLFPEDDNDARTIENR